MEDGKVRNIFSSTAGASSSTFHVYRSARRAELDRVKKIEDNYEKQILDQAFAHKLEENEARDKERTLKNSLKRKKRLLSKRLKKEKSI